MSTVHDADASVTSVRVVLLPELGSQVHRFGRSERLLHWWVVVMYSLALLTGVAMGNEAESGPLLQSHIAAVVLIGAGILIVLLFGDTMAVLRSAKNLLIFDRTDVAWVVMLVKHPFNRDHFSWGKFNLGQKVLAWSLLGSLAGLIVTGINSWSTGGETSGPHSVAVIVSLVLIGAHVFMALLNPSTRPALPGMIFGHVSRSWATQHHGGWLAAQDMKDAKKRRSTTLPSNAHRR